MVILQSNYQHQTGFKIITDQSKFSCLIAFLRYEPATQMGALAIKFCSRFRVVGRVPDHFEAEVGDAIVDATIITRRARREIQNEE